ncbi:LemA family protein [soil metagenome]
MKYIAIFFAVIVLGVIVTGFAGCSSYNGIVASSQAVDRQWAQVQNVYQRRADLVPNLVATVQGSANFEKSTLTDVIKARAAATSVNINSTAAPTDPNQLEQFDKAQGELSRSLGRLLVSVERYPDLKANQNFLTLQAQLEGTENRISTERERFNQVTQDYNTRVQTFPTMLVTRAFAFTPKPYFTATAAAQTVPQVNFNFGSSSGTPATAP